MGTLAGSGGIGVAPGAQWIAARIFDSTGWAYDSWIHAGFQWILAPGGDAAQAPDVLSNSWGSDDGGSVEFQPDVQLLNAAGIATFFSNGNAGPNAYSVGSPASFPESFGVGAVDENEQIAWFSSRGPSPWNSLKPEVSAPGVNIRSSLPGGGYGKMNGTSMAAPQVAGVAALLRSAAPGLSIAQTALRLNQHDGPTDQRNLSQQHLRLGTPRCLQCRRVGACNPDRSAGSCALPTRRRRLPVAVVRAESRLGTHGEVTTNEAGAYTVYGPASLYTLTVSAFGYAPQTMYNVPVYTGTTHAA